MHMGSASNKSRQRPQIDGSSGNSVCMMHATIAPLDSETRESINRSTVPCLSQIKPHYYHWLQILNLTSYLANWLKNFLSLHLSALPQLFGDDQTLANFLIVIYMQLASPSTCLLHIHWTSPCGGAACTKKRFSLSRTTTSCTGITGLVIIDSSKPYICSLGEDLT